MTNKSVIFALKSLEQEIVRFIFADIKMPKNYKMPTPTQMQIISYILERNGEDVYKKDLEKVLRLRRATVSGVLGTMEKNNLIKRIINEHDTRSKKIILNAHLATSLKKHINEVKKWEDKLIKNISQEDMDIFIKVINQMKENIEYNNN